MNPIYWLVLFIVLLVIEIITLGLTTIWFAGGAIVSFVAALLGANLVVQVILFLVVSVALLLFARSYALKHLNVNTVKTNVSGMAGKTGVVIEDIDTLRAAGRVKVEGMEWAAITQEDEGRIVKDTVVEVLDVTGVKLVVRKKEE